MWSRFSASSSVISSDLLRVRFMYISKVCRVPRIILLFRSLILMTLLIQPSNILTISEDNHSPQNYVDLSWISSTSFTLSSSSGSWLEIGSKYSNFQIFSLFFIVEALFMSGGLFNFASARLWCNRHKLKPRVEWLSYSYTLYTCTQFLVLEFQSTSFLNFWHNIIHCWLSALRKVPREFSQKGLEKIIPSHKS